MSRKPSGKTMVDKVWVAQKNGTWYCYERSRVWQDGKMKQLGKRLLGKADERGGELRPTRPKRKPGAKGDAAAGTRKAPNRAAETKRRHTTMCDILEFIGTDTGIDEDLRAVTDRPTADKAISLARFLVATDGNALPGYEAWQLTHPVPCTYPIDEDDCAQLLRDVGTDDYLAEGFFEARIAREKDAAHLAYDFAAAGANTRDPEAREGTGESHMESRPARLLALCSAQTGRPLAYAKQPGSVSDVLAIGGAVEALGILGAKGVTVVTDAGAASELSLGALLRSSNHILTEADVDWGWVREQIDEHWDELNSIVNTMVCDLSVKGATVSLTHDFPYKRTCGSKAKDPEAGDTGHVRRRVYLHMYYSAERKEEQDRTFWLELKEVESLVVSGTPLSERGEALRDRFLDVKRRGKQITVTWRNDELNEACRLNGLFALVSDNIRDATEALLTYRTRGRIEDHFGRQRSNTGCSAGSLESLDGRLDGRLFVTFLAMCYAEDLRQRIREMISTLGCPNGEAAHDAASNLEAERRLRGWLEERSLHHTLAWFDAYETAEVSTDITRWRWGTEATERDTLFLRLLGMAETAG